MTRAIVIGGSLGGLTAALVLRDQGWDVDVLQRSPNPLEGASLCTMGLTSLSRPRGSPALTPDFDDYRIESIQVGIIEVVETDDDYDDD